LKAVHYIILLMSSEDKNNTISWVEDEPKNRLEQMATLTDPVSPE